MYVREAGSRTSVERGMDRSTDRSIDIYIYISSTCGNNKGLLKNFDGWTLSPREIVFVCVFFFKCFRGFVCVFSIFS